MRLLHIAIAAVCGSLVTLATQKVVRAMKPAKPPPAVDLVAYAKHGLDTRAVWKLSRARPDIIMVGDSITRGAPWADLTGCPSVATRAMGGEFSGHILSRVDDLIAEHPKAVVLMVGINDLSLSVAPDLVASNVASIVGKLTAAGIAVYRLPVLPVTASYTSPGISNATIDALNSTVSAVAGPPQIDPRPALAPAGVLPDDASTDGLHLSAKGYATWLNTLQPVIDRHCLSSP